MRFYGDRRSQWGGYIMLLLTVALAAATRSRPRAGSLQGKIDGGNQGYDAHPLANQSAGVYEPPTPSPAASAPHSESDQIDRHRNRRRLWLILPVFLVLLVAMCAVTVLV